jgi:hypothetical protein
VVVLAWYSEVGNCQALYDNPRRRKLVRWTMRPRICRAEPSSSGQRNRRVPFARGRVITFRGAVNRAGSAKRMLRACFIESGTPHNWRRRDLSGSRARAERLRASSALSEDCVLTAPWVGQKSGVRRVMGGTAIHSSGLKWGRW